VVQNFDEVPVIESRASNSVFVDAETERPDQVQWTAGRSAQPRNVAGVGRDFGLDEHDVERPFYSLCAQSFRFW
jgi:hypothetical protein